MIDKSSLAGTFIIVSRLLQFYLAPVVSLTYTFPSLFN